MSKAEQVAELTNKNPNSWTMAEIREYPDLYAKVMKEFKQLTGEEKAPTLAPGYFGTLAHFTVGTSREAFRKLTTAAINLGNAAKEITVDQERHALHSRLRDIAGERSTAEFDASKRLITNKEKNEIYEALKNEEALINTRLSELND